MPAMRLGVWLRFALLMLVAACVFVYSPVAGILAGLGSLVVLYRPALLMPLVVALLVWLPMRFIFSAQPAELVSTAVMANDIETGDSVRQVTILALFGIGLLLLLRVRFEVGSSDALRWFFLFLPLALLSELWSADPALTARRTAVAICCTVFAAGMAVGYYGQHRQGGTLLVRHICVLGSLACAAVLVAAIAAGNFHLFDLGWRLGSFGRENQFSWVAALVFLAIWVTRHNRNIWHAAGIPLAILAVSGTALLLSKSRTSLIATAAGLLTCEVLNARSKGRIAAVATVGCLLLALASSDSFGALWKRGASDDALQTVSGRTELWDVVWRDVCAQPWLGYGYGAYWTSDRVHRGAVEWAPTSAHNGYLDIAAELGFTGLVIMFAFLAICWRNGWQLRSLDHSNHDIGVLLLSVITSFLVINTGESYADALEYFPVLATLTLAFYVSYVCAKIGMTGASPAFLAGGPQPRTLTKLESQS
jgi:exopolysaccharide production protein ExoQ